VPSSPSYTTPDISSTTLSNLGIPPTYTSPTVTGNAGLTGMEAGTIADGTDQIEFDTWWDIVGDMIETGEDIELATAQIQKINSYIGAFQAEVQDAINVFNDANAEYQGKLQEAVQQAQISSREAEQEANLKLQKESQEYESKLRRYSNSVQTYQ
jgi:RNAse (barnase) inhibitor barstar